MKSALFFVLCYLAICCICGSLQNGVRKQFIFRPANDEICQLICEGCQKGTCPSEVLQKCGCSSGANPQRNKAKREMMKAGLCKGPNCNAMAIKNQPRFSVHPSSKQFLEEPSDQKGRQFLDESEAIKAKTDCRITFDYLRFKEEDVQHSKSSIMSQDICNTMCNGIKGSKSYVYFEKSHECSCLNTDIAYHFKNEKFEKLGASKECDITIDRCTEMKGNCFMDSEDLNTNSQNTKTLDDCQFACKTDPLCNYYKFNYKSKTCQHYPNRRLVCSSFLGVPTEYKKDCNAGTNGGQSKGILPKGSAGIELSNGPKQISNGQPAVKGIKYPSQEQEPGKDVQSITPRKDCRMTFDYLRFKEDDVQHSKSSIMSIDICNKMCSGIKESKSYVYFEKSNECSCLNTDIAYHFKNEKFEKLGASKQCQIAFNLCTEMEGNCYMDSENLNTNAQNNKTPEDCQFTCTIDPMCNYYKFNYKSKSCLHYSNRKFECSSFLGIPTNLKRNCPPEPGKST